MSSLRILISGAGVAGLGAALVLARAGVRPVVVERSSHVRAGGFLVSLSQRAFHNARELGLVPALRARSAGIRSSSYHDERGRTLLTLDTDRLFRGIDVVQVMRDELVAVMFEAARDCVEFRFGDEITRLEARECETEVDFRSGGRETYDLVVGADGLDSAVRRLAFDARESVEYPLGLLCAAYRSENVLGLDARFATHMQKTRYMASFNTGKDDIGNVFVWTSPLRRAPAPDERRETLIDAFAGAGGAIQAVLDVCPVERIYMDALRQIELPSWVSGRAVLIGDAAHCLTLFSGRGAGAALNGGCALAKALIEEPTVEAALARYQAEMRPIIDTIQPATRRAVRWYVPGFRALHLARSAAMRMLPTAIFERYFRYKYGQI